VASVFSDPSVEPTTSCISDALGAAREAWAELTGVLVNLGAKIEWRYYRDGGWLVKASKGGKTVAWLQVNAGYARITCYFAERHRETLAKATDIPAELREQISSQQVTGKLLPITLQIRDHPDVVIAATVLNLKQSLK